jgi:prenyltransferase beta subunit
MYVETSFQNSLFYVSYSMYLKRLTQSEVKVFKMNDDKSKGCKPIYWTWVSVWVWSEKIKEKDVANDIDYVFRFILASGIENEIFDEQNIDLR